MSILVFSEKGRWMILTFEYIYLHNTHLLEFCSIASPLHDHKINFNLLDTHTWRQERFRKDPAKPAEMATIPVS